MEDKMKKIGFVMEELDCEKKSKQEKSSVRNHNVGSSDYSKHKIQPWDIWMEYHLNPWDADIIKRVLRTKIEPGLTPVESRILDYNKIIHICHERINQLDKGYEF